MKMLTPPVLKKLKWFWSFQDLLRCRFRHLEGPPVSPDSLNRFMVAHYLIFRHKQLYFGTKYSFFSSHLFEAVNRSFSIRMKLLKAEKNAWFDIPGKRIARGIQRNEKMRVAVQPSNPAMRPKWFKANPTTQGVSRFFFGAFSDTEFPKDG